MSASHSYRPNIRKAPKARLMLMFTAKKCGVVAYWSGRRTCSQEVAGSSPGRSALHNNSGQVVHTHVPLFTKQYKLVPVHST